jgi:hypothetical protein
MPKLDELRRNTVVMAIQKKAYRALGMASIGKSLQSISLY